MGAAAAAPANPGAVAARAPTVAAIGGEGLHDLAPLVVFEWVKVPAGNSYQ